MATEVVENPAGRDSGKLKLHDSVRSCPNSMETQVDIVPYPSNIQSYPVHFVILLSSVLELSPGYLVVVLSRANAHISVEKVSKLLRCLFFARLHS